MENTVDLIKKLIIRLEMNRCGRKNKKIEIQLTNELKSRFSEVLTQEDDNVFLNNFKKIIESQVVEPYISSNFFPESMKEYAEFRNIFGFSNDFKFEIRWMIACIMYRKDVINNFVTEREKYDDLVLFNKYEDALQVIDGIEGQYGVSYWSTECRFFLYSKLGKNVADLIEFSSPTIFNAVLNFYELKNRESVTSDEYYYIAEKEITSAKKYIQNADEMIEFYNYEIAGNSYSDELEKIMLTMRLVQRCSLIDRYLFLINVCDELMNQPKTSYFYQCMQTYITMLCEISDNHLTAIRFVFDTKIHRKENYILKSRLDGAKTKFILGKLKEAREEAVELLKLFPNNTEAMSLLVETNILINDGQVQFQDTNLGNLLEKLSCVYKLNDRRDDAMETISKFALTCSLSTWAQSIISDILSRCYDRNDSDYKHHKILGNLQHLDIETLISSLDEEECKDFIVEKLDSKDPYVQFRKSLLNKEYQSALDICGIQEIKDYLYVRNKNTSTLEKIAHLHLIDGNNSSISIDTMKCFLSSVKLEEDWEIAFNIAANLVIDNIYTALFIPWKKIISFIDNGPTEIRKNLCTPILYYVFAYYIERDKKDDLGIVVSNFLELEDIERPSQMKKLADRYEKKMLVYFLKNVCIAKTMDDAVYVFENPQERDQERVEICNLLMLLDGENQKEYENEIRELTQKLMINKELKIIDESRIHVNVEGIKEKLINAEGSANRFDNNLKNDFQRYIFYQDDRVKQWFRLLEGEEENKFVESIETSYRLLQELVQKIRDAFVSSGEYGLNGYLSLNIRHSTLEDELRSPLQRAMLYAKKDNVNKTYIVPSHWTQFVGCNDKKILCNAFGEFHCKTEKILSKLKSDYIQVRTELKGEKGVFDYRLTKEDYDEIACYADNIKTFEEFFDMVITYLWSITERNLENIKYVIRNEIKKDYMDAFSDLRNAISGLSNKTIVREIQQKISEVEIDMQNVLEHICHWFQRSNESKHSDFDLQFAFDLGLETIKNMHPEAEFVVSKMEDTISDKIPGRYIKSYDGIFYNLFDNIYKKATPRNNKFYIKYELRNLDGNIRIYIENEFDCTQDISSDLRRVEIAKEIYRTARYAEKAKGEGGTGIPKICKIIKYDLLKSPFIDFGYKKEENKFYMEIKF